MRRVRSEFGERGVFAFDAKTIVELAVALTIPLSATSIELVEARKAE